MINLIYNNNGVKFMVLKYLSYLEEEEIITTEIGKK